MDIDERARLRALVRDAALPWSAEHRGIADDRGGCIVADFVEAGAAWGYAEPQGVIVESVNALPALLGALDAADRAVELAEGTIAALRDRIGELEARLAAARRATEDIPRHLGASWWGQQLRAALVEVPVADPCEGRETHHARCECHEARRDAEVAALRAEVERLRAENAAICEELGADSGDWMAAIYALKDAVDAATSARCRRIAGERDAATAEVERLRAALATARRDAEEACASRCDEDAEAEAALGRSEGAWALRYLARWIRSRAKGGK